MSTQNVAQIDRNELSALRDDLYGFASTCRAFCAGNEEIMAQIEDHKIDLAGIFFSAIESLELPGVRSVGGA